MTAAPFSSILIAVTKRREKIKNIIAKRRSRERTMRLTERTIKKANLVLPGKVLAGDTLVYRFGDGTQAVTARKALLAAHVSCVQWKARVEVHLDAWEERWSWEKVV